MDETMAMVYNVADIEKALKISRSKSYAFINEVMNMEEPYFRVIKVGKSFRVPKVSFERWLLGEENTQGSADGYVFHGQIIRQACEG